MVPEKLGNKENSKREYMDPPEKGKQTRYPEKIRRLSRKGPLVILDCVILTTKTVKTWRWLSF